MMDPTEPTDPIDPGAAQALVDEHDRLPLDETRTQLEDAGVRTTLVRDATGDEQLVAGHANRRRLALALRAGSRRERRAATRIVRTDPLKDALARVRAAQLHEALAIVDDAFTASAVAGDITASEATP